MHRLLVGVAAAGVLFTGTVISAAPASAYTTAPTPVPSGVPQAGQAIINQAVGTYDDGNSHNFYTTSNQVVVTVQNAPGVTVSATGGKYYTDGNQLVDAFVITNTGNATGALSIPSGGEQITFPTGSGAVSQPAYKYYLSDPSQGNPTAYNAADISAGGSQAISIPSNGTQNIWVAYPVPYGVSAGTITTSLNVALAQAAVAAGAGNGTQAAAGQSANGTGSTTDSIATEAQLDLNTKFIDGKDATAGTLQIQTDAQNSGGMPAHGLQSAQATIGSLATRPGILIVQQMPVCANCSGNQSKLTAASTVQTFATNGYVDSGVQPLVVYAHDGTYKTWDTNWQNAPVTAVAVFLTCTNTSANVCINGTTYPAVDGTQLSKNDGNAGLAPHPAVTILSTMSYPTGYHSSDANAFSTISNGAIEGNVNNDVLAPGYTDFSGSKGTSDAATVDLTNALSNKIAQLVVTGASNIAQDQAPGSYAVANGPLGQPDATGILDQLGLTKTRSGTEPTRAGDFTAFVLNGNAQGSAIYSINNSLDGVTPPTFSLPVQPYMVENTLRNEGTTDDTFSLASNLTPSPYTGALTLPNGWTVTFNAANPDNSLGSALANNTTPVVHSGDTYNYFTVYTPPSGSTLNLFQPYEAIVTAASVNSNGGANSTGVASDQTIHVMFVNGYIKMTKSASSDIASCPASISGLTSQFTSAGINVPACPGALITYTTNYQNIAPDATQGTGNISLTAKNFKIIEDGNGTSNPSTPQNASNWAAFSSGLTAGGGPGNGSASDSQGGVWTSSDGGAAFGARWIGNTIGSKAVTDVVGTLAPQAGGTLTYTIQLLK